MNDSLYHKEQERRSLDLIRVYNPLEQDFVVKWDKLNHHFPALSEKVVQRYLAEQFCVKIKDHIINERTEQSVAEMLAKREKQGLPELSPFEKQTLYGRVPGTNDEKLIQEIYELVYIGLEEEFGTYREEEEIVPDTKSASERVFEKLSNRRVQKAPSVNQPVEKKSKKEMKPADDLLLEIEEKP